MMSLNSFIMPNRTLFESTFGLHREREGRERREGEEGGGGGRGRREREEGEEHTHHVGCGKSQNRSKECKTYVTVPRIWHTMLSLPRNLHCMVG